MTPGLWGYLFKYALQHQAKGNGAGFGLFDYRNEKAITRAISARYHKDGSEILINDNGLSDGYREQAKARPERNFDPNTNTPRRLTPLAAPQQATAVRYRFGRLQIGNQCLKKTCDSSSYSNPAGLSSILIIDWS